MDQDKTITAKFFTQCGDVNGDLNLSPQDAQQAFDIFLGRIADPTEAQRENADVNNDGIKSNPMVTPMDAHSIFKKYLGQEELPGDCSCKNRADDAAVSSAQRLIRSDISLRIDDIIATPGTQILVPVVIINSQNINSFGFDIVFPSELLDFVGIARTELASDFIQMDGFEKENGVVRIGGYREEPIAVPQSAPLVALIFQVKHVKENTSLLLVTETFDDIANAQTIPGKIQIIRTVEPDEKKRVHSELHLKK